MSAAADLPLEQLDVITPESFEAHGYPHEAWARLRAESPIHYFGDQPVPFWAVTKHGDQQATRPVLEWSPALRTSDAHQYH